MFMIYLLINVQSSSEQPFLRILPPFIAFNKILILLRGLSAGLPTRLLGFLDSKVSDCTMNVSLCYDPSYCYYHQGYYWDTWGGSAWHPCHTTGQYTWTIPQFGWCWCCPPPPQWRRPRSPKWEGIPEMLIPSESTPSLWIVRNYTATAVVDVPNWRTGVEIFAFVNLI